MMYSSAPSIVPMRTSSTNLVVLPHTLPDRVRTVMVSAVVSTAAVQGPAPGLSEPEQAARAASAVSTVSAMAERGLRGGIPNSGCVREGRRCDQTLYSGRRSRVEEDGVSWGCPA
jgi:hypothetical protein